MINLPTGTVTILEALEQTGAIELRLGHFEKAHGWLDEGVSILRERAASLGTSRTMAYDLGDFAFYEGNYELAQKYYEDCLSWARQKGMPQALSWAKVRLGYVSVQGGEWQSARSFFGNALRFIQTMGTKSGIVFMLEGLASLAVAQNEYDKAVRILAWTDVAHEEIDLQRPHVEQAYVERDLAKLHSHLDDASYAARSAEGRALTMEQAIELALED